MLGEVPTEGEQGMREVVVYELLSLVFESYILPAVKSNDPLPPNPAAAAKLEAALKALQ
jgi:hypothetical protein